MLFPSLIWQGVHKNSQHREIQGITNSRMSSYSLQLSKSCLQTLNYPTHQAVRGCRSSIHGWGRGTKEEAKGAWFCRSYRTCCCWEPRRRRHTCIDLQSVHLQWQRRCHHLHLHPVLQVCKLFWPIKTWGSFQAQHIYASPYEMRERFQILHHMTLNYNQTGEEMQASSCS